MDPSYCRPGQEGPSFAPPSLPEGWIAQWDGMGRKYYFVQLSTGTSQWDTPTQAAPTGPTPQATPQGGLEHPYGTPADGERGDGPQDGERGLGVGFSFSFSFSFSEGICLFLLLLLGERGTMVRDMTERRNSADFLM